MGADLDGLETFVLAGELRAPNHVRHGQPVVLLSTHLGRRRGQMEMFTAQGGQRRVLAVDCDAKLQGQVRVVSQMRNVRAAVEGGRVEVSAIGRDAFMCENCLLFVQLQLQLHAVRADSHHGGSNGCDFG